MLFRSTPIHLWDVSLRPGKTTTLPLPEGHTTAILVLEGSVVTPDGRKAAPGDLAVYSREGGGLSLMATDDGVKLLLMSGEPIDEPVVGYGPFVMNSLDEIRQAYEEFQKGGMGRVD